MNEKEWLDYFEIINNRQPTAEEIQQAKASESQATSSTQRTGDTTSFTS